MITEEVTFFSQGLRLVGTLYSPPGQAHYPVLIVLHAANGGMRQHPFYQHLATALPARGIAVLIYDRRGSGQSAGDFQTADFEDLAGDAVAAIDYLCSRSEVDGERVGLYGISQGGWIAPIAAIQRPQVACQVIVSGCGVSPAQQMDYGASYTLRAAGYSEDIVARALALRGRVNEYYRGHLSSEVIHADLDQVRTEPWVQSAYLPTSEELPTVVAHDKWYYEMDFDPLPVWHSVRQPTLFLFAADDRWVPIEASLANFRAATTQLAEAAFVRIEGTDHLMYELGHSAAHVSSRYIEVLLDWLAKWLSPPDASVADGLSN